MTYITFSAKIGITYVTCIVGNATSWVCILVSISFLSRRQRGGGKNTPVSLEITHLQVTGWMSHNVTGTEKQWNHGLWPTLGIIKTHFQITKVSST